MAGRRLSVLQLLPALEAGGVEEGTLEIARALVEAGHRSLVVSGGGRLVGRLREQGSEHLQWPIGAKSVRSIALVPALRALIAAEGVDVVHARSRVPAWIAWLALGRPRPGRQGREAAPRRPRNAEPRPAFVTTAHGFYRVSRYSAIMTRGDRVIAVSEAIAHYLREHYRGLDPARIEVIHRGVDRARLPHGYRPPEPWMARWRADYPALAAGATPPPVLTLPGRISRLKGHGELLALLAALRRQGIPAQGIVAGGIDPRHRGYYESLRRRSRELGLDGAVHWIGHRDDLREVMAVSDIVLSLSARPESFGRTVLEALALGRPVVGWDRGGVGEILGAVFPHGRVPPGDREGLVATVRGLLQRREGGSPLPVVPPLPPGAWDVRAMQARTLALYETLVEDTPGRRHG